MALNRLLVLCALCVIAYAPTFTIPLIADDYPNLMQARSFASLQGAEQLLGDPTFRLRSTSYWAMQPIWLVSGTRAWSYHAFSLAFHLVATLLVYALARLWIPMRKGAFAGAAFFAVYEGHQEAVMWFSAINELLLFCFGVGAVVCWILAARSGLWHAPGILLFTLALLSKESAIIVLPLMLLVHYRPSWLFLPYVLLGCAALASVAQSGANSFRFSDGSFSLHAPFWLTLPHTVWRLFWPWGMAALLVWIWRKLDWRLIALNAVWMLLALLPYAFLTYSTAIPSRQVYLASAGLAMIVGLACHQLWMVNPRVAAALAVIVIVGNAGYLWTKKREQFEGPVPGGLQLVAEDAVRFAQPENLDRLIWQPNACSSKQ